MKDWIIKTLGGYTECQSKRSKREIQGLKNHITTLQKRIENQRKYINDTEDKLVRNLIKMDELKDTISLCKELISYIENKDKQPRKNGKYACKPKPYDSIMRYEQKYGKLR